VEPEAFDAANAHERYHTVAVLPAAELALDAGAAAVKAATTLAVTWDGRTLAATDGTALNDAHSRG
jgi:hypothetical protein